MTDSKLMKMLSDDNSYLKEALVDLRRRYNSVLSGLLNCKERFSELKKDSIEDYDNMERLSRDNSSLKELLYKSRGETKVYIKRSSYWKNAHAEEKTVSNGLKDELALLKNKYSKLEAEYTSINNKLTEKNTKRSTEKNTKRSTEKNTKRSTEKVRKDDIEILWKKFCSSDNSKTVIKV